MDVYGQELNVIALLLKPKLVLLQQNKQYFLKLISIGLFVIVV